MDGHAGLSSCSAGVANLRFVLFWLELINDVLLILMCNSHKLRMTTPGHNHVILVDELDTCERDGLPNCSESVLDPASVTNSTYIYHR